MPGSRSSAPAVGVADGAGVGEVGDEDVGRGDRLAVPPPSGLDDLEQPASTRQAASRGTVRRAKGLIRAAP
jgi:hypothetical protein